MLNGTNTIACFLNVSRKNDFTLCGNVTFVSDEYGYGPGDKWFWGFIGIFAFLVLFAGFTSGLSIGIFSLDELNLKTLSVAGSIKDHVRAERILPLLRRHHLLLVTLLIANAAAVEAMPIILQQVTSELFAIIIAVCGVFLGAVLFQPISARYGLTVSYLFAPFLWVLIGLLFVVAWPISLLLDCLFGEHHMAFFGRSELKALVGLHAVRSPVNPRSSPVDCRSPVVDLLTSNEVQIIQGALDMHCKVAKDAMIEIDRVIMLDIDSRLDAELGRKIFNAGHSRLPVYENKREQVVGILLVKDLIATDLDTATPLRQLILHEVSYVHEDVPLYDVLREFRSGKGHLSAVYRVDPDTNDCCVIGVTTLEDVMKELLQHGTLEEEQCSGQVQLTRLTPTQLLRVFSIVGQGRRNLTATTASEDVGASPQLIISI